MASQVVSVPVPLSVSAGAAAPVEGMYNMTAQISGTFTAVVQLQGQISGSTTWFNIGGAFTNTPAAGAGQLDITATVKSCSALRANVTGYTSGTPILVVSGTR